MNLSSTTTGALASAGVGLFLVVGVVLGANGVPRPQTSTTPAHADPPHLAPSPSMTSVPAVDVRTHDPVERDAHESTAPAHTPDLHAADEVDHASSASHPTAHIDADGDHASDHWAGHDEADRTQAHESAEHDGESHH
jgi:hypothetical protein